MMVDMSYNENIMSLNSALFASTLKGRTVNGSILAALSLSENTYIHTSIFSDLPITFLP